MSERTHLPRRHCFIQVYLQGVDGLVEPGQVSPLQHEAPADPWSKHPEAPHQLLHDHPRFWLPRHCSSIVCHTGYAIFSRQNFFDDSVNRVSFQELNSYSLKSDLMCYYCRTAWMRAWNIWRLVEVKVDLMRRQATSSALTLWVGGGVVEGEEQRRRGGGERWSPERGCLLIIFAVSTSAM